MTFIPQLDILDANGNSLIQQNADGSIPIVQVQLATGLKGTFSKDGDLATIAIAPDGSQPVTATSITFGSGYTAMGGQFEGSMPGSGGSPVSLGSWTVATGRMLTLRAKLSIYAALTGFGVVWAYFDTTSTFINAGAGVQAVNSAFGTGAAVVPPFSSVLASGVSGNTVSSSIGPLSVPAWAAGTMAGALFSYGGGGAPTAIASPSTGCSIVSHSGLLYVCSAGGNSTVAPTGTGGPITGADGVTWYEFGSAASGVPFTWTLHEFEVLTG